jgi:pilus assembly protein Flp/PilA
MMKFHLTEKGQGLVEYALILVLVAIVVIAVLMLLGPIIGNTFSTLNDSLSSL